MPFFIFLSIIESVVFGLGVSFIVFGWPLFKQASRSYSPITKAMFVSIAWLLVSWWPHDNLHASNGMNLQGLLFIEYVFHLTLMIAVLIIANGFFKMIKQGKNLGALASQ